jgi:hypothetical protein
MSEAMDLKTLERRAYLLYYEDGLLDLFVGLVLVFFGLQMRFELGTMSGMWILWPLVWMAKRLITYPRIGMVKFRSGAKAREGLVLLIVVGVVFLVFVAGLVLFLGVSGGLGVRAEVLAFLRRYSGLVFGGAIVVVLVSIAAALGVKRFYAYAGLALPVFGFGWLAGAALEVPMMATGALVALAGLTVLVRFLRAYPLPGKGAPVESADAL